MNRITQIFRNPAALSLIGLLLFLPGELRSQTHGEKPQTPFSIIDSGLEIRFETRPPGFDFSAEAFLIPRDRFSTTRKEADLHLHQNRDLRPEDHYRGIFQENLRRGRTIPNETIYIQNTGRPSDVGSIAHLVLGPEAPYSQKNSIQKTIVSAFDLLPNVESAALFFNDFTDKNLPEVSLLEALVKGIRGYHRTRSDENLRRVTIFLGSQFRRYQEVARYFGLSTENLLRSEEASRSLARRQAEAEKIPRSAKAMNENIEEMQRSMHWEYVYTQAYRDLREAFRTLTDANAYGFGKSFFKDASGFDRLIFFSLDEYRTWTDRFSEVMNGLSSQKWMDDPIAKTAPDRRHHWDKNPTHLEGRFVVGFEANWSPISDDRSPFGELRFFAGFINRTYQDPSAPRHDSPNYEAVLIGPDGSRRRLYLENIVAMKIVRDDDPIQRAQNDFSERPPRRVSTKIRGIEVEVVDLPVDLISQASFFVRWLQGKRPISPDRVFDSTFTAHEEPATFKFHLTLPRGEPSFQADQFGSSITNLVLNIDSQYGAKDLEPLEHLRNVIVLTLPDYRFHALTPKGLAYEILVGVARATLLDERVSVQRSFQGLKIIISAPMDAAFIHEFESIIRNEALIDQYLKHQLKWDWKHEVYTETSEDTKNWRYPTRISSDLWTGKGEKAAHYWKTVREISSLLRNLNLSEAGWIPAGEEVPKTTKFGKEWRTEVTEPKKLRGHRVSGTVHHMETETGEWEVLGVRGEVLSVEERAARHIITVKSGGQKGASTEGHIVSFVLSETSDLFIRQPHAEGLDERGWKVVDPSKPGLGPRDSTPKDEDPRKGPKGKDRKGDDDGVLAKKTDRDPVATNEKNSGQQRRRSGTQVFDITSALNPEIIGPNLEALREGIVKDVREAIRPTAKENRTTTGTVGTFVGGYYVANLLKAAITRDPSIKERLGLSYVAEHELMQNLLPMEVGGKVGADVLENRLAPRFPALRGGFSQRAFPIFVGLTTAGLVRGDLRPIELPEHTLNLLGSTLLVHGAAEAVELAWGGSRIGSLPFMGLLKGSIVTGLVFLAMEIYPHVKEWNLEREGKAQLRKKLANAYVDFDQTIFCGNEPADPEKIRSKWVAIQVALLQHFNFLQSISDLAKTRMEFEAKRIELIESRNYFRARKRELEHQSPLFDPVKGWTNFDGGLQLGLFHLSSEMIYGRLSEIEEKMIDLDRRLEERIEEIQTKDEEKREQKWSGRSLEDLLEDLNRRASELDDKITSVEFSAEEELWEDISSSSIFLSDLQVPLPQNLELPRELQEKLEEERSQSLDRMNPFYWREMVGNRIKNHLEDSPEYLMGQLAQFGLTRMLAAQYGKVDGNHVWCRNATVFKDSHYDIAGGAWQGKS